MSCKMPNGVSNFPEIRADNACYVDKTAFLDTFLQNHFQVSLFLRPPGFGKSLLLSMLDSFFDCTRSDGEELFAPYAIFQNRELCSQWMNNYPVLFLNLKPVSGNTLESAVTSLGLEVRNMLLTRYSCLLTSNRIHTADKRLFAEILDGTFRPDVVQNMPRLLCNALYAHHGKNVIVLMDDLDAPLANATSKGWKMASFMDHMLSSVLKDNPSLQFAILMGLLRPAQSSMFTGFNNFKSFDSANSVYNTAFGFTPSEVRELCRLVHADSKYDVIDQWYGGYRFGDGESLCNPRDICNYINDLGLNPCASPQIYLDENGCTDIVREVLKGADSDTIAALAHLASGGSMVVSMNSSLNCANCRDRPENIWPLLYHTGYLTRADVREIGEEYATLTNPNQKIGRILQLLLESLPGSTDCRNW